MKRMIGICLVLSFLIALSACSYGQSDASDREETESEAKEKTASTEIASVEKETDRDASFPEWFMKKMFRSRKKKLAKTHVDASPSLVKMYGYDFAKMMTKIFERITIADIDNICHACPELTKIFCENDERIYGKLLGLIFERTGTLGKGAQRCDFLIRKL